MLAKRITPILNVSNIEESFAWFERLGWKKGWDWGDPPTFGGVCSGHCEIFLCLDGQGGRGKSTLPATFGEGAEESQDKGVWMSIWVDEEIDAIHQRCLAQGVALSPGARPSIISFDLFFVNKLKRVYELHQLDHAMP